MDYESRITNPKSRMSMSPRSSNKHISIHQFLDEAGDTAFYGKGRIPILGTDGVSKTFIIGMVKFNEPLTELRRKVLELQARVACDPYYAEVPSVQKKNTKCQRVLFSLQQRSA